MTQSGERDVKNFSACEIQEDNVLTPYEVVKLQTVCLVRCEECFT